MYVDGFLLAVPKKKLAAYKAMSRKAGKVWLDHGALTYVECAADVWGGFAAIVQLQAR